MMPGFVRQALILGQREHIGALQVQLTHAEALNLQLRATGREPVPELEELVKRKIKAAKRELRDLVREFSPEDVEV